MTNYQTEHNILVVAIKYNPVISEKNIETYSINFSSMEKVIENFTNYSLFFFN